MDSLIIRLSGTTIAVTEVNKHGVNALNVADSKVDMKVIE